MDKVLVLAPHADDAEISMGGYLHRMMREQTALPHVAIFAYGNYRRADGAQVTFAARKAETLDAMQALGGVSYEFVEGFAENWGDTRGRADTTAIVERLLDKAQPTELFIPLRSYNQDHIALHEACVTALRPGRFDTVARIWGYEYGGNCWGPQPPLDGRCYVKLRQDDVAAKVAAMMAHVSQGFSYDKQHAGFTGALALSQLRGSEAGTEHAELFYLLREIY